jgi:O-glycosyl hydrolase
MRVIALIVISTILLPAATASATDVVVDGATRYQTIEGFGTCLIAWSGRFRQLYRKHVGSDF